MLNYQDSNGDEFKTGWYASLKNENLYFIEKSSISIKAFDTQGHEFGLGHFPKKDQIFLLPNKLYPSAPDRFKNKAQNVIDFINSKQSLLEQLSQTSQVHPLNEKAKHQFNPSPIKYDHPVDGSFGDPLSSAFGNLD